MLPPDVFISWPKNTDFPLFRKFLKDERTRFNEILIVFTEPNHGNDYAQFVKDSLFEQRALCFYSSPLNNATEDWRNVAIHSALRNSLHSEWILFLEQDFIPQPGFWDEVERLANAGNKVIGVYEGTRLHPCFLLMRREILKKTSLNFSANPPYWDHFGHIQKDLINLGEPIGDVQSKYWYHMAGLSHNCRLMFEGQMPNHKIDEFVIYLKKCLLLPPETLEADFQRIATNFIKYHETA